MPSLERPPLDRPPLEKPPLDRPQAALIDGKTIAAEIRAQIGVAAGEVVQATGRQPCLRVLLVGDHPASLSYVRSKERAAAGCNIASTVEAMPQSISQADLLGRIAMLNADPDVDGILVQLPLPRKIDLLAVIGAIDPAKDVDGFHERNVGGLAVGRAGAIAPCTPYGCMVLLQRSLGTLRGLTAFVLGRSNIVGKPMAQLLLAADCTVIMAHSKTPEPWKLCRQADIVVAAVGRAGLVTGDWLAPGAAVIDVGMNRVGRPEGGSHLVGDVDFTSAVSVAGHITPVPGGVGPMTIAMLLRNTVLAAAHRFDVALRTPLP